MTRVIHTGDTHVGYRQYHSPERRADFLRAFEGVIEDAVDEDVDAVVHAGDLFHDRRPELPDLMGVLSALRDLEEAGIPFLAVVGNHEATRGGQWLDLFESLGLATRLGAEPTVVGDVAFYGLDHVPRSRREDLDYDFAPNEQSNAALVAHGLFTPFTHGDWDTETVLAEASVDVDAMLLGDNHVADTAEVAGTWVTYCGSTERASASERDARGYNLVEFGGDEVDIRRRSLETREFVFVDVDLAPGEGVERVIERVREHDLADAVVIVEIDGEGEPVAPAAVEEPADDAGALVARVTDHRELDHEDAELSVSFADPDEAVRERVDEMGLSSAALALDRTVRESKTADSNVRETVETRVRDLLDEDPGAFVTAGGDGEAVAGDEEVDGTDDASGGGERSDDASGDGRRTDDVGADSDGTGEAAPDAGDGDDADDDTDPDADEGGDQQASMEEYL